MNESVCVDSVRGSGRFAVGFDKLSRQWPRIRCISVCLWDSSFRCLKQNMSIDVEGWQVFVFDCESEAQPGGDDFNAALLKCLLKGTTSSKHLSEVDAFWKMLKYTMLWNRGT